MVQIHPISVPGGDASSSRSPTSGRLLKIVETSPCERFAKFNKTIHNTEKLEKYLGYDSEAGVEVTWNVLKVGGIQEREAIRILEGFQKLQSLDYPNIVHISGVWIVPEKTEIIYTTDLPTSRSLREFIDDYPITLSVLRRWCRPILEGLRYLHEMHKPSIIHGNLSYDNIFINGRTGYIRVGGLELSCLEPPEDIKQRRSEDDIAAFGLCLIDIIVHRSGIKTSTLERQQALANGILPNIVSKLLDSPVKKFIHNCIVKRKPASLLLEDDFMRGGPEEEGVSGDCDEDVLFAHLVSA